MKAHHSDWSIQITQWC